MPGVPVALRRGYWLVLANFAMNGFVVFSWMSRIPTLRAQLALSTSELGVVLLVGSLGGLCTSLSAQRVLLRWGPSSVFAGGTLLLLLGLVVMGVAPVLGLTWLLMLGIIVQGVGAALSAVVLGVESTRVERAFGRTVIPQFHAAYSAGAVGGSVVGAACSLWAVSVAVQFSVAAAVVTVVRLAALRAGLVLPAQPGEVGRAPNAAGRPRTTDWLDRRTLLIAVVAFATVLSEGAANNWLSVAVVDGFGQAESAGGIVLGVFIGGITLARALGSKLIDRFGRVCILRFSLVLAIAGLLAFGLVPTVELGVVAAAAWGLGTGLGFPISVGAASDHQPHAAPRVSLMLAVTMAAGMAAPPLLGFAAGALGVRHALLLVVALLGLGLLAAGQVAPLDPGGKLDRPGSGTGGPSLEPGAEAQVGSSGTTGRG